MIRRPAASKAGMVKSGVRIGHRHSPTASKGRMAENSPPIDGRDFPTRRRLGQCPCSRTPSSVSLPSTASTCWIPAAEVERVAPARIPDVELRMEALAELADGLSAERALGPFVEQYRTWIKNQKSILPTLTPKRREMTEALLQRAGTAAGRADPFSVS